MTHEQIKLIQDSEYNEKGSFKEFLFLPLNSPFNDEFNNMIVFAGDLDSDKWYRISWLLSCDAFNVFGDVQIKVIDVPAKYNCIRVVLSEPLEIELVASNIMLWSKSYKESLSKYEKKLTSDNAGDKL